MKKLGCIVWILAFVFVASFFKISLLWILLLPVGLLLVYCGLFAVWAGMAWTYSMITDRRRKPEVAILSEQSYPPFQELKWSDDSWQGKILLPAWAGFQSRGGDYGSQDSDSPSDGVVPVEVEPNEDAKDLSPDKPQCLAMKIQIEQGDRVVQSILTALLPHYREKKNDSGEDDEYMPPVSSVDDFRKMMGLSRVYVRPYAVEGLAYIGLECGCDWEEEHGLGIVLHGTRIIEIGEADIAFSWRPAERQSSLSSDNVKGDLS